MLIASDISGSNSNGDWERNADGSQYCSGQDTLSITASAAGSLSNTLPKSYSGTSNIGVNYSLGATIGGGEFIKYIEKVESVSSISLSVIEFSSTPRTGSGAVRYQTSGRWY